MTAILIIVIIIACIIIYGWLFMKQPKFGKPAQGKYLEQNRASPNFKDGKFQNIHNTPAISEDASYSKVMMDFFFGKSKQAKPLRAFPKWRLPV